jgi:sensor histidine kinase YesM
VAALPLKIQRFRLLFATCWALWTILQFLVLYWFGFDAKTAITDSIISNVLLSGACLLITQTLGYYLPRHQLYTYIFMLCIILAIIWLFVSRTILMIATDHVADYKSFFTQSLPIRFAIGFLLIGCMALLSVLWYTLQDHQENEKRKIAAEKLAKEAELYKLRQQLQPHFLFNSLNSINALIGLQPQQARTMIQQLSDFLRGTLKKEEHQWISLEEELEHLSLYLQIEQVRFGHRLSVEMENNAGDNKKLPVMLLQPIVENAIKFGLYDTTGNVTIYITAKDEEENLMITIKNPYDVATSGTKWGTGFGLSSVQRRLYLLFARNDLLKTETEDLFFITTIKIPQHHDQSYTD